MSLKSLIAQQRLRVDAHSRGAITPKDLSGVHIHKTFIGGRWEGKSIRIYVNGRAIQFDKDLKNNERLAIQNKIEKVLEKNRGTLMDFAGYTTDALWRWTSGDISLEKAQEYSRNIAKMFDLRPEIEEEFIRHVKDRLMQYISLHKDEENKEYLIDQNTKHVSIAPGKVYFRRHFRKK